MHEIMSIYRKLNQLQRFVLGCAGRCYKRLRRGYIRQLDTPGVHWTLGFRQHSSGIEHSPCKLKVAGFPRSLLPKHSRPSQNSKVHPWVGAFRSPLGFPLERVDSAQLDSGDPGLQLAESHPSNPGPEREGGSFGTSILGYACFKPSNTKGY